MDSGHPSLEWLSGCAGQGAFPSKHMQTVHKPPRPSNSKPQGAKALGASNAFQKRPGPSSALSRPRLWSDKDV